MLDAQPPFLWIGLKAPLTRGLALSTRPVDEPLDRCG